MNIHDLSQNWLDLIIKLERFLASDFNDLSSVDSIGHSINAALKEIRLIQVGQSSMSTDLFKLKGGALTSDARDPEVKRRNELLLLQQNEKNRVQATFRASYRHNIFRTILAAKLVEISPQLPPKFLIDTFSSPAFLECRVVYRIQNWSSLDEAKREEVGNAVIHNTRKFLGLGQFKATRNSDLSAAQVREEHYTIWSVAVAARYLAWELDRSGILPSKSADIGSLLKSMLLPPSKGFQAGKGKALLPSGTSGIWVRGIVDGCLAQVFRFQTKPVTSKDGKVSFSIEPGRITQAETGYDAGAGSILTGNSISHLYALAAVELLKSPGADYVEVDMGNSKNLAGSLPDKLQFEHIDAQHPGIAESIRKTHVPGGRVRYADEAGTALRVFAVEPHIIIRHENSHDEDQYLCSFTINVREFESETGTTEFVDIALVVEDDGHWQTVRLDLVDRESEISEDDDRTEQNNRDVPVILDAYVTGSNSDPDRAKSLRDRLQHSTWHYRQGELGLYFAGAIHA